MAHDRQQAALDVHRDGLAAWLDSLIERVAAVYDGSGAAAFHTARSIVDDDAVAERIVEQAFREIAPATMNGLSAKAAGLAVRSTTRRLAHEAWRAVEALGSDARPTLRVLAPDTIDHLRPDQRIALELAVLEGLPVSDIADRMQSSPSVIHRVLGAALIALKSGRPIPAALSLRDWREAQRAWNALSIGHPDRRTHALAVAYAWLEFQESTRTIQPDEAILIGDEARRYIAASANAARVFGRRSVVGLRVGDLTTEHVRRAIPNVWAKLVAHGSTSGTFDSDRPGQTPLRIRFQAYADRPLAGLFVIRLRVIAASDEVPNVAPQIRSVGPAMAQASAG